MRKLKFYPLLFVFMVCILGVSCTKEQPIDVPLEGQVTFSLSLKALKSAKVSNPDTAEVSGLSTVVVTIEDAKGKIIKNSEKIDLFNMNGSYITKPISLLSGSYKLTGFMVLDWKNNVIYASPLASSAKAYLVQKPLPLAFNTISDSVTKIVPQVISAVGSKPEDFGYVDFGFEVVKTFDFLVGAFIYNETVKNYQLTTGTIEIYNNTTLVYSGNLLSKSSDSISKIAGYDSVGVTNKITLPASYTSYKLIVAKPGYKTYTKTFTREELKMYFRSEDKGPLVVILNKNTIDLTTGLVAYYKFNGDALDYSGSNNNGTLFGRGLYNTGYKSDTNGAIDLNGSTDYVTVNNSLSLNPTTQISVCAWYYSVPFYGNGANSIVAKLANQTGAVLPEYQLWLSGNSYSVDHSSQFGFCISTEQGAYPLTTTGTGDFQFIFFQYALYKWYYLVGTYDGTTVKLFVNGELKAWTSASGKIVTDVNDLYLGNTERLTRPQYDYTKGKIDEVRIYNRALSETEIQTLYQQ